MFPWALEGGPEKVDGAPELLRSNGSLSLEVRQSCSLWDWAREDTWHSLGSHRDQLMNCALVPHTLLLKAWTGTVVSHQKEQGKCVQESKCFCH